MTALQEEIEQRLAVAEPQVEVLLAEVLGGGTLRVFIDHPDGVSLSLCERVSGHLSDMRDRYTLEVSSPGNERPLSKPDHFRRYIGHRARVRVRGSQPAPQPAPQGSQPAPQGSQPAPQPAGAHIEERPAPRAHSAETGAERSAARSRSGDVGAERSGASHSAETGAERSAARSHSGGAGSSARRRSYTGELMGASESEITLAAEEGIVAIPYSDIRRCNLVEE